MPQHQPTAEAAARDVATVRRFNRFYTRLVGALDESHLDSTLSLTEARLLYELATRESSVAADLTRELRLDAGYLSRLLRSLEERGLVERTVSASDGRRQELRLTPDGQQVYQRLLTVTDASISTQIRHLSSKDRQQLVSAMTTIEDILGRDLGPDPVPGAPPVIIRGLQTGDLGRGAAEPRPALPARVRLGACVRGSGGEGHR
ncbi:MAG: winged helix-turn-helix transcriptional regulator [Gemmatimonadaceae bacterium]|nr:winged helix-turn-helix transcriptional regulator [Gemmatimonadaceae bacterium]